AALLPVSTIIADRLGYYFIPLQALIFARIPWMQSLPSRPILAAAPYLGLLVFFVVWTMSSGHFQSCYIPYQSWILGVPCPKPVPVARSLRRVQRRHKPGRELAAGA